MMEILGVKRIVALTVSVLICAALGGAAQLYLSPKVEKLEFDQRIARSRVSDKRNEINLMRDDLSLLEEKQEMFYRLQDAGLFSEQSRYRARQFITDVQRYTDILSATYAISTPDVEDIDFALNANYAIVHSEIVVSVEAVSDVDIYKFGWWIENTFPGHVVLTDLEVKRSQDVDDDVLKEISRFGPQVLAEGKLTFAWSTLASRPELIDAGLLKAEGAF